MQTSTRILIFVVFPNLCVVSLIMFKYSAYYVQLRFEREIYIYIYIYIHTYISNYIQWYISNYVRYADIYIYVQIYIMTHSHPRGYCRPTYLQPDKFHKPFHPGIFFGARLLALAKNHTWKTRCGLKLFWVFVCVFLVCVFLNDDAWLIVFQVSCRQVAATNTLGQTRGRLECFKFSSTESHKSWLTLWATR